MAILSKSIDYTSELLIIPSSYTTIEWTESILSVNEFINNEIRELEKKCLFKNEYEVITFLKDNYFLLPVLFQAILQLQKYFQEDMCVLEYTPDYDDLTGHGQIILYIVTTLDANESHKRLKEFDNHWWLNNIRQAKGKLCINMEFR